MQGYSIRKWLNIPQYKITKFISEEDKDIHIRLEPYQRIESVALDGAKHYINSTNRYAVNALIVYDRFHITQKLNPAFGGVDMVRKEELRKARADENNELVELINCRQRFILLKNPAKGGIRMNPWR